MPTVYVRTLRRAAQIVGGVEGLAFQLEVNSADLAIWLAGTTAMPQEIFLRAVDIVTAHEISEISGTHPNLKTTAAKGPA